MKPKLDRFILTELGEGDYKRGCGYAKEKDWLIGQTDHYALDYKMRIEPVDAQIMDFSKNDGIGRNGKPIRKNIPLYFGDIGNQDNKKKMAFTSQPICLSITCIKRKSLNNGTSQTDEEKENEIINLLNKYISKFFFLHNFGTRQSKGFGSFSVTDYPINYPNVYAYFSLNSNGKRFGTWDCYAELFDSIDLFYKTIRSGINQNDVYFKSLMYHYAIDQDSYWDKRTIRYKFNHFTPSTNDDKGEKNDRKNDGNNKENVARLYRDMLGLSSSQKWKSYNDDEITKESIDNNGKEIERFKSPLLFKPIYKDNSFIVYIIPTNLPCDFLGKKFKISSRNRNSSFEMETPQQFDICDFLSYITDENITKWVVKQLIPFADKGQKSKTIKIAETLISIYQNIKYVEK